MPDHEEKVKGDFTGLEIAVIGMAGRFPGARDIHEFWNNLEESRECITFFSHQEMEESGIKTEDLSDLNYIKANPFIQDIDFFDAPFFGYSPGEAKTLDPQVRIFLECIWHGLEDAGYNPDIYDGLIGLYAGASGYILWEGISYLQGSENVSEQYTQWPLRDKDFLSTHISYRLNLRGPSITIYSACSTGLVAIHMACRALLNGECKMALAGGVTANIPGKSGYFFQEGMIASPDGHCRAFDAQARGTVFGNGVGVVVLKRLKTAVTDRDNIYAVIKGSAVNNDGSRKMGYTAPSISGQSEVIRMALRVAKVKPESITYIEAHGTGTPLGDPVEIEALTLAFNTNQKKFCAIGSVKTNVGHLDIAAGIASFIKTVLALKYRVIPPSLHFQTPNPKIDFENSPFCVNTRRKEWKNETYPLRAGVSSFGIGGTNSHVILEEAPPRETPTPSREYQLILLSAKIPSALEQMTENLVNFFKKNLANLENHSHHGLADAVYTLAVGRKTFKYRRMVVCSHDVNEVIDCLSTPDSTSRKVKTYCCQENNRPIVFMFPGLGGQYVNMGRELYEKESHFRQEMDRCFEILEPLLDYDIKEILYPINSGRSNSTSEGTRGLAPLTKKINQFEVSQLVIFIFEYTLAKLLIRWGIKPHAMIGYSFGEYTAACLSGVFALEDALKLVVARGRLIQKMPEGAMLSVPLPVNQVEPLVEKNNELSLSIDNGNSCVVSGPNDVIDTFEKQMKEKKILCMRIPVSRAIHSKMTGSILSELEQFLNTIRMKKPQIPYISSVTGDWISAEEVVTPAYWTKQLRQTVRFDQGMKTLAKDSNAIYLEVGAGRDIISLTTRYFQDDSNDGNRMINLVRHQHQDISDIYFLLNRIGMLWLYDHTIDWSEFYSGEKRRRIPSLPAYPFERQRYWLDENPINSRGEIMPQTSREDQQEAFADWFYTQSWKRTLLLSNQKKEKTSEQSNWLVFVGEHSLGSQLVQYLAQLGEQVTAVEVGTGFTFSSDNNYKINPQNKEDYQALLGKLKQAGRFPDKVIHLWGITAVTGGIDNPAFEFFDRGQELGFYSLLYFTQALEKLQLQQELQMVVVTNDMQEVTGKEKLCPGKSTVLGPVKVIPQEHPSIICRSVDITLAEPGELSEKELIRELLEEFTGEASETVIAYRGPYRWVQTVEPMQLEEGGTKDIERILKDNGVYLLTGGLGEIGLVLAEFLVTNLKAKLVLTGRSAFPSREEWNQWLDSHDDEDSISRKIKKLQHLETLGGEIMLSRVDVADYQQMHETITRTEEKWGPIQGIIHLAGTVKGPTFAHIVKMSKEKCEEHFRAKMYGVMVLDKISREKKFDFVWLMSSISSILGGLGFVAYSAANNFMDAFVHYYIRNNRFKNMNKTRWLRVNWDILEPEQMVIAFQDILALENVNHLLISTGGRLQQRIDRWIKLESVRQNKMPGKKEITSYSRPNLTSPYEAPTHSIEQTIVELWQQLFGFEPIGILDDFFELEGDSLKAITVIARIHKYLNVEIPIEEFFDHPTIKELARYIRQAEISAYSSIEPVEKKEYYPLSSAQKRFYFLQQMEPGMTTYNLTLIEKLQDQIDGEKLESAFQKMTHRHESLRTSFEVINGEAVQRIHKEVDFSIEYFESSESKFGEAAANFVKCFDLSQIPLFRLALVKMVEQQYILLLDMHHIISDGMSMGIFTNELIDFYWAKELPPLNLQYKDFCQWQNHSLASGKLKKQEEYWLKQFPGKLPVLNMPTDYPRPLIQSFAGDVITFYFSEELTDKFNGLMKESGTTLYMMILAIYNVLLRKYTRQNDIIVGSPISGRINANLEKVIGLLMETIATRNFPQGNKTFEQFLQEVKENTLKAFENQAYPFRELLKQVGNENDRSRNPLFDAMLIVQNFVPTTNDPGATELKYSPYEQGGRDIAAVDINLEVIERENDISFFLEYCTKLFNRDSMEKLITSFQEIAAAVVDNKKIKLDDIKISYDLTTADSRVYEEVESEFKF